MIQKTSISCLNTYTDALEMIIDAFRSERDDMNLLWRVGGHSNVFAVNCMSRKLFVAIIGS